MRLIVAPGWFMKLPNDHELSSKAVLDLYGYKLPRNGANHMSCMIARKSIPPPDKVVIRPRRNRTNWTVGYLKRYLKLPTELEALENELKHERLQKEIDSQHKTA